jgi:chromosome partitioning protein
LQVASLGASHHPLMMRIGDGPGAFASLPRRSCTTEAQAAGEVLWKMKKAAARDARREIEPSPKRIAEIVTATAAAITTQEISHAAATR